MSEWTHQLTIAVPESMMADANQLALAIGTSVDDVNTFRSADWTDGLTNYSVACTRAVSQIFDYLYELSTPSDVIASTIDVEAMQRAMQYLCIIQPSDCLERDTGGSAASDIIAAKGEFDILVFVDVEPMQVIQLLGLSRMEAV